MLLPPLQGASQAARLPASKPPPGMAEHCAGRAVAGVGVPSLDAHSLWPFLPPFLPPAPLLLTTNAIQCLCALANLLPPA